MHSSISVVFFFCLFYVCQCKDENDWINIYKERLHPTEAPSMNKEFRAYRNIRHEDGGLHTVSPPSSDKSSLGWRKGHQNRRLRTAPSSRRGHREHSRVTPSKNGDSDALAKKNLHRPHTTFPSLMKSGFQSHWAKRNNLEEISTSPSPTSGQVEASKEGYQNLIPKKPSRKMRGKCKPNTKCLDYHDYYYYYDYDDDSKSIQKHKTKPLVYSDEEDFDDEDLDVDYDDHYDDDDDDDDGDDDDNDSYDGVEDDEEYGDDDEEHFDDDDDEDDDIRRDKHGGSKGSKHKRPASKTKHKREVAFGSKSRLLAEEAMLNVIKKKLPPCRPEDLEVYNRIVKALKEGKQSTEPYFSKFQDNKSELLNSQYSSQRRLPFCIFKNEVFRQEIKRRRKNDFQT